MVKVECLESRLCYNLRGEDCIAVKIYFILSSHRIFVLEKETLADSQTVFHYFHKSLRKPFFDEK